MYSKTTWYWSASLLLTCSLALAGAATAQTLQDGSSPLDRLAFSDDRLHLSSPADPLDAAAVSRLAPEAASAWAGFAAAAGDGWTAYVDPRTGRVTLVEGAGVPWIPGYGNRLTMADLSGHLDGRAEIDSAAMESIARGFLRQVAPMLGVDPRDLVLSDSRTRQPADYLWFVEFDVLRDGYRVEGARVAFRVNNGNLVQFGTENLPDPRAGAPLILVDREPALKALAQYIGGFAPGDLLVEEGALRVLPIEESADRGAGATRGMLAVWEFAFHRKGVTGTWRGRVDATSGGVVEFLDANHYGRVTGGVYLTQPSAGSTIMPMPFADPGANSAGIFPGSIGNSSLNGPFVTISDTCGSINEAASGGDISFGTSGGTNCTTPGHGGAGNTHSSRTQYYHLNRIKEVGRGWLPGNAWLNADLTARVNLNQTCNAYWNGSTVNFFRSGGGCGNTGELPGVSLHEYGHGLDSNDGNGSQTDLGSGETYGDFTAALQLHDSCIGPGFLGSNCGGYGDPCTACTGVRDIDWAQRVSNTPHTVANFTQPRCPTSATYRGPCGREGHCESYVSSEALWDLANRDLSPPGSGAAWTVTDRLWYLSRSTQTKMFNCTASGTWTSNGCFAGSLWRTFRAVDDDDGNLNNGTPHGGALFAAFNRHGIACTTDAGASTTFAGCTPPATPSLSLTPGDNSVTVSWTSSGGGVVYDVYRNELGCNAGFTKIANDVGGISTVDTGVANGDTYFYQVVAQPSGNEACGAVPTTCQSVVPQAAPCTPPAAPTGLVATATGSTSVALSWNAVGGATEYRIFRSTASGGPYTQVGTSPTNAFTDGSASCATTYFYVVRAFAGCESANSNEDSATTDDCDPCTVATLYSSDFQTGSGLADWGRGSFGGSGTVATWRGIQTCSGARIFRYGGSSCTGNYTSNNFNFAEPATVAGIAVPAGSSGTTLTFRHRRQFETGFDGGTLTVSLDGFNYELVPSGDITGTNYNGTVAPDCAPPGAAGIPIFTGTDAAFTTTSAALDGVCDFITGGTGGCAGQTLWIGFTAITDCSVTADGWFLDDVTVTACTP